MLLPVLLLSTILIREPGLEGTTCPVACAPAEYHLYKGARPRRDTCPITCAPAEYHLHKGARPRRDHMPYCLCSC